MKLLKWAIWPMSERRRQERPRFSPRKRRSKKVIMSFSFFEKNTGIGKSIAIFSPPLIHRKGREKCRRRWNFASALFCSLAATNPHLFMVRILLGGNRNHLRKPAILLGGDKF